MIPCSTDTRGARGESGTGPRSDFGRLIPAAHVVADESPRSLNHRVDAGRRAGMSWAGVGDAHGISRRATRQRFANPSPDAPGVSSDDREKIVRTGVAALDEVEVISEEGRSRTVVGATWRTLFSPQMNQPYENVRVVSPRGAGVTQKSAGEAGEQALA